MIVLCDLPILSTAGLNLAVTVSIGFLLSFSCQNCIRYHLSIKEKHSTYPDSFTYISTGTGKILVDIGVRIMDVLLYFHFPAQLACYSRFSVCIDQNLHTCISI